MRFVKKVNRIGGSLFILLPSYWTNLNDIQRGDSVICQINKDNVLELTKEVSNDK